MKEEGPITANTSNSAGGSSGDALSSKLDEIPPTTSLASPYLSKPSRETAETPQPPIAAAEFATSSRKDRLYIGNIHHTVDEYTLLQIFQKYGRVAHLDFLFHKNGPMKGRPRGYAFLEYVEKEDALKAVVELHDKPFRGRNLQVKFANQMSTDPSMSQGSTGIGKVRSDPSRSTALSLLKSSSGGTRSAGTEEKIRAMERKLQQMQSASAEGGSINPRNAGLPAKPLPSLVEAAEISSERAQGREQISVRNQLPVRATAVAVGKPVTEILQVTPPTSATMQNRTSLIKSIPKASSTRKQIKGLSGIKLKPKR